MSELTEYEWHELAAILDRIWGSDAATGYELLEALEREGYTVIPK